MQIANHERHYKDNIFGANICKSSWWRRRWRSFKLSSPGVDLSIENDGKPGGPSRKYRSNIFNEPPVVLDSVCWRQSLVFFVSDEAGETTRGTFRRWRFRDPFPTNRQTSGVGKWRLVRGHRANGIDNKQELQRAVQLSDYQRSLAWYSWFIGGSQLVSLSCRNHKNHGADAPTFTRHRIREYIIALHGFVKF